MLDQDSLRRLADDLPDSGEPDYPTRSRLRREVGEHATAALLDLEKLCAVRAYPAWQAQFPHDDEPMRLLRTAREDPGDSALPAALGALNTTLDNAFDLGPEAFPAIYAGFACLSTARHAVAGQPPEQDSQRGEIEIDPHEWSACFLASLVAAGGAVWEPDTDARARREYWRWYLLDAVPSVLTDR